MLINKIFSMFLSFCILFSPKYAKSEERLNDYEYVLAGQCVYQNGFFFSEPGMANLYLLVDEKIKTALIDKQKEISNLKLDLEKCSSSKLMELKIQKEMYEHQLLIKQQVIDSNKTQEYWNNLKLVGYVVAGVGTGFLLGYVFANK